MNFSSNSFSVELAAAIGVREAIILQHFYWWHEHNTSVKSMNTDGQVWFYLSAAKLQQTFPYLTLRAVRTIVANLLKNGYIIKDHKGEGQSKFDHTSWFSLTDKTLNLFDLSKTANRCAESDTFDLSKTANRCVENGSIVNNIVIDTSSKEEDVNNSNNPQTPKNFDFWKALAGLGIDADVLRDWRKVRKAKRGIDTEIAFKDISSEIRKAEADGHTATECIRLAVVKSWAGFRYEWMQNELEGDGRSARSSRSASGMERNTGSNPRGGTYMQRMAKIAAELGINDFADEQ